MEITLQGSLKSFRLAELLSFLSQGAKSGALNLVDDGNEVYIYFVDGSVVFATSNQEKFRLSALLLRKKKIDEAQWRKIEEQMAQHGEKFGKIAVEKGVLSDLELRDYLKIQVSEILFDCFAWSTGKFTFIDVLQLPPHAVTISIDHQNLIMEGSRRIQELSSLLRLLPGKSAVLKVVGDLAASPDKLHLSLAEWKVSFLIDGTRTIEEICKEAPCETLEVYRLIYGLYANKMVEVVSDDEHLVSLIRQVKEETVPRTRASSATTRKFVRQDVGLLISPDAKLTIHDVLKVTLARLTWKRTDSDTTIFPLVEQEYFVGRQPGNEIHIPDPSISNVHARIFKGPEGFVVEDLDSRNGTYLNGQRIERALLRENDIVRVGNSSLSYSIVFEVQSVPNISA